MLVLLVGPKGSGKSHIGRILERSLGVHFFHVEPVWMRYHEECTRAGTEPVIAEGIDRVRPLLVEALARHDHICVETTGASREILDDLLSLVEPRQCVVVRVTAPLELCLERIATRDQTHQIPLETETVRRLYELSSSLELHADIVIENPGISDEEVVARLATFTEPRN